MAAVLCYPYGVTITCVCDNTGSVYNCYPTNYKNKHQGHVGANSQAQDERLTKSEKSRGDQTVEIILATTALVTVIALFLSFLIYRLEKYLVRHGYQIPLFHKCNKETLTKMFKQKNSSSCQTDPIIYWYSQNQTVVGITHITTQPRSALPPATSQAKLYPSLPLRRHSYSNSPDSAIVSTRPSFSSTLPCSNSSRSRCSPYDVTDHKSDQMSTPIELNDIPSDPITLPDTVESIDQELPDPISVSQELDNNYDEAYDDISFVNHSLSQQPLLNMSTFTPTNV